MTQALADPSTRSSGKDRSQMRDLSSSKSVAVSCVYKVRLRFFVFAVVIKKLTFGASHVRINSFNGETLWYYQQFLNHVIAEKRKGGKENRIVFLCANLIENVPGTR